MKGPILSGILAASLALLGRVAAVPTGATPARVAAEPNQVQARSSALPTVSISSGTIIGTNDGVVQSFNGIPFAQPPTGSLRLRPPVKLNSSLGTFNANGVAAACPQFIASTDTSLLSNVLALVTNLPFFQTALNVDEDCLTITVVRPAGTVAGDKLPVLFWIFGGGFELGWSSMYDGVPLATNAVNMGKPYIFVAVNYRVGGFGFLPGAEVLADGASNLGLLDQRMGLEWVADNIAAFGGDPDQVTIWGESAGAISVLDQMVMYDGNITYNGKPLFRGGIMNSGSIVPADPVDCPKGQDVYNRVVNAAGCNTSSDTLNCLRGLDYSTYLAATEAVPGILSYQSIALRYLPRPDGTVLTDSPDKLIEAGKYAAVPMIIGDQEDEGTLFSLFQSNISTTAQLTTYLQSLFFNDATTAQIDELVALYADETTYGSPFRTGSANMVYSQFKRLAAILGDLTFTLTRRACLTAAKTLNPSVPVWSYLGSYDYGTPILGTFHGSDLLQVFYGILPNYASKSIQSYYANFVYNLDPNNSTGGTSTTGTAVALNWPEWTLASPELVQIFSGSGALLADTFRNDAYVWILNNINSLYI